MFRSLPSPTVAPQTKPSHRSLPSPTPFLSLSISISSSPMRFPPPLPPLSFSHRRIPVDARLVVQHPASLPVTGSSREFPGQGDPARLEVTAAILERAAEFLPALDGIAAEAHQRVLGGAPSWSNRFSFLRADLCLSLSLSSTGSRAHVRQSGILYQKIRGNNP